MSTSDLKKKYGDDAFSAGLALQPTTFERRLDQRDRLDQHFTQLWLDFQVLGMSRRSVLEAALILLLPRRIRRRADRRGTGHHRGGRCRARYGVRWSGLKIPHHDASRRI